MNDGYKRAKKLFLEVCDLETEERLAVLDNACGDDSGLRADVDDLLAHDRTPQPAPDARSDPTITISADGKGRETMSIGSYRVIREIGRGGMGVVYLAVREGDRFKRRVAIKVLKRGTDTETVLRRFELERQVLAALNHQNIARLYDGGETEEGLPYFVMEYVEGLPIDQYCDTRRLRIGERLELFRQACAAVHYAHQNLVVHRDIKPGNILVTKDGVPKLLDFGIAKLINPELSLISGDLTAPEFRVMTPEYASPEQVRGEGVTTASDVYSLGVLLYEIVCGHRPYQLRSRIKAEIERVICEEDPEKPSTAISRIEESLTGDSTRPDSTKTVTPESVSRVREGRPERLRRRLAGDIDNIVLMALRKEPQRRYTSALQFAEDIKRHLDGLPVLARRDTVGYRTAKFVRRHRIGVAAAAVIVLLLVGGITGTTMGAVEARDQRNIAQKQRDIAQEQRERAEARFDQVRALARTFMFDFHDAIQKLEGSLPARELLVTTAVKYLDGLAQEVDDHDELQRELASGYDRVGEILGGVRNPSFGGPEAALERYRTALDIREALSAASPGDLELQKEVWTSLIHVGDMLVMTGDTAGALAACREALNRAEALARANPKYRRAVMIALNSIGKALRRTGRLTERRQYYEWSLEIAKELAAEKRDELRLQRDLSVAHLRMREVLATVGDHEGSLAHILEAIAVRHRLLVRQPHAGRYKRDLAIARYYAGQAYLLLGQPERAMEHLEPSLAAMQQRVEDSPETARAKRDLAVGHEMMGRALAMREEPQRAVASYLKFQSLAVELSQSEPQSTEYRGLVARSYERLGEIDAADGQSRAAARNFREALRIVESPVGADPTDLGLKADRARILTKLGAALRDADYGDDARTHLESAFKIYQAVRDPQPENAGLREDLARTLHELSKLEAGEGQVGKARLYVEQALNLLNEGGRSAAGEELRQALEEEIRRYREEG